MGAPVGGVVGAVDHVAGNFQNRIATQARGVAEESIEASGRDGAKATPTVVVLAHGVAFEDKGFPYFERRSLRIAPTCASPAAPSVVVGSFDPTLGAGDG